MVSRKVRSTYYLLPKLGDQLVTYGMRSCMYLVRTVCILSERLYTHLMYAMLRSEDFAAGEVYSNYHIALFGSPFYYETKVQ